MYQACPVSSHYKPEQVRPILGGRGGSAILDRTAGCRWGSTSTTGAASQVKSVQFSNEGSLPWRTSRWSVTTAYQNLDQRIWSKANLQNAIILLNIENKSVHALCCLVERSMITPLFFFSRNIQSWFCNSPVCTHLSFCMHGQSLLLGK